MRSNGNVKLTDIDDYPAGEYFVNTEVPSISGKFYLRTTETPTKDSTKKLPSALSGHMMLSFTLKDAIREANVYTWGTKKVGVFLKLILTLDYRKV